MPAYESLSHQFIDKRDPEYLLENNKQKQAKKDK